MAYKTSDLKKKAIEVIEKYKLIFIEEIVSYLPCNKKTFYNHNLHELHELEGLLQENKDKIKSALRSKWYKTDNATLQLALMRLICTDKERRKLAINYTELTGKDGEAIKITAFNYIPPDGDSNSQTNGQATPRLSEVAGQDD